MTSVLTLMGLTLSAPDHTTVSRRAVTLPVIQAAQMPCGPLHVLIDSTGLQVHGAGQWLEAKRGASGMIVARTLTDQDVDDPSQVSPLLDQINDPIGQVGVVRKLPFSGYCQRRLNSPRMFQSNIPQAVRR